MKKIIRVKYDWNNKTAKGYGRVHRGELVKEDDETFTINRAPFNIGHYRDIWTFDKQGFHYEVIKIVEE